MFPFKIPNFIFRLPFKAIFLSALFFIVLFNFLSPSLAFADVPGYEGSSGDGFGNSSSNSPGFWVGIAESIFEWLLNLVGNVLAFVIYTFGHLLGILLNLNSKVLQTSFVQEGWRFTRDLANIGFVLGIIVISFATIIRYDSYGWRKLLVSFIIVALLVNFSLVIAGVILDFAGLLTATFVNMTMPGDEDGDWGAFATKIAGISKVDSLLYQDSPQKSDAGMIGSLSTNFLVSFVIVIIFTFLFAIVSVAIAIMFLIRFIALAILLILAPVAWLAGIFPHLKQYSQKWWNSFLKWVFFAPAATFFLMLAVMFVGDVQSYPTQSSGTHGDALSNISQLLVACGFLIASVTVASKLGLYGANASTATYGYLKGKSIDVAARTGLSMATRAGRRLGTETAKKAGVTQERAKDWAEKSKSLSFGKRLSYKLASKAMNKAADITSTSRTAATYDSTVSKIPDSQLAFEYNSTIIDKAKKAAIINAAIKKGKVADLKLGAKDVAIFKSFGGDQKKLAAVDPTLSKAYLKALSKYLESESSNTKIIKLKKHIEEIKEQKEKTKDKDEIKKLNNKIQNLDKKIEDQKAISPEIQKAQESLDEALRQQLSDTSPSDVSKWNVAKIAERLKNDLGENIEKTFWKSLSVATPRELSQITQGNLGERRRIISNIAQHLVEGISDDLQSIQDDIENKFKDEQAQKLGLSSFGNIKDDKVKADIIAKVKKGEHFKDKDLITILKEMAKDNQKAQAVLKEMKDKKPELYNYMENINKSTGIKRPRKETPETQPNSESSNTGTDTTSP